MLPAKPSDNEIVLTRTFEAPRAAVFAALTRAEHLVHWMETEGMTLVACETNPKAGGTFRYVFQRPSGAKLEVRGSYEAMDPPRQFVYTETYDFSPLSVLVTTTLEEDGAKTVLQQMLRYSSKRERDEDYDGVVSSATEAFSRLERYLADAAK